LDRLTACTWLKPGVNDRAPILGFCKLVDGRVISVPLAWYPRLWYGSPEERAHFEIIGDSSIFHWPDLNEDLRVSGILAGKRSGESPESLKKWLAGRETKNSTK